MGETHNDTETVMEINAGDLGPVTPDQFVDRYIRIRQQTGLSGYGRQRRSQALRRHLPVGSLPDNGTVIDIGTADGLILRDLAQQLGTSRCIGIDTMFGYVDAARQHIEHAVQANGVFLPFPAASIDAVVSTATFKHIRALDHLIEECHRVLKSGGKLVIGDPTPLGIKVGALLGHFHIPNIAHLNEIEDYDRLLARHGFRTLSSERYMLSPVPFPGSGLVESLMQRWGLDRLFLNQIVAAEKR